MSGGLGVTMLGTGLCRRSIIARCAQVNAAAPLARCQRRRAAKDRRGEVCQKVPVVDAGTAQGVDDARHRLLSLRVTLSPDSHSSLMSGPRIRICSPFDTTQTRWMVWACFAADRRDVLGGQRPT